MRGTLRHLLLALLAVTLAAPPAAAGQDTGSIPTGDRPAELTLETEATLRGPGTVAADLRLEPLDGNRLDACTARCGDLAARLLFTVDGEPQAPVLIPLGIQGEPVTVLAPRDLTPGERLVGVTAIVSWTPGPEWPGSEYRVVMEGPRVEGVAFAQATGSMGPPALASLGLLSVLGVLVTYFTRRET